MINLVIAETDVLIAEARGDVDPVQKIRSLLPEHLEERSAFEVVEEKTVVTFRFGLPDLLL